MTRKPPFPIELSPHAARRQAVLLLAFFYSLVYGVPLLLGPVREHALTPMLSSLLIGALMLGAVALMLRRDRSIRHSLAIDAPRLRSAVAWSLLGLAGTYAANILLTLAYVSLRGGLTAVAARRASWMATLADLPVELILPLALFAGAWEELVFRGFLLGRLRAAIPEAAPAGFLRREALPIALTAICFGAGHGYQGGLGLMQTTVAGLVLGALTVWRGTLWPAVGAHLAIDAFGLAAVRVLKGLA